MSIDDLKIRILNKVNLADLVGESIKLTNRSGRPVGCCPIHEEKSPSFYIYDRRYYCFGCKASGDAIEFVRQVQGLSFMESLKYLAEKYSIEAPELTENRKASAQRHSESNLYKVLEAANAFYQKQLFLPENQKVIEYLTERGFSREAIEECSFGVTPKESYGLVRHLRQKGAREKDILTAGLATSSSRDGNLIDFFRQRIMIPIKDPQGRVIAFGGRTTQNHSAKYMNSRDTLLYDKSKTLFGFDKARTEIRKRHRAIVVEGYMDVFQLWNHGFKETVGCLGTALTEPHLKLLSHATAEVVLLFDGDSAGKKATLSSVTTALAVPQIRVRAAILPEKMDPDDFLKGHGSEAMEELLTKSADLLDFAIRERIKATHKLGIPTLIKNEFIPWLSRIPDPMQRSYLVTKIAELTGVGKNDILRALSPSAPIRVQPPARKQPVRISSHVEEIIGHIFYADPGEVDAENLAKAIRTEIELPEPFDQFTNEILATLKTSCPAEADWKSWTSSVEPEIYNLIEKLRRQGGAYDVTDRRTKISEIFLFLRKRKQEAALKSLKDELHKCSRDNTDPAYLQAILTQISEINQKLRRN